MGILGGISSELLPYQQLGARMADFCIRRTDLEARINAASNQLSQDQIRAVVTGYVDNSMRDHSGSFESLKGLYELIHGFARGLYNGSFQDVRDHVLGEIAGRVAALRDYGLEDLERFFRERGDVAALTSIAERLTEKKPEVTYLWFKGEQRPEMLRRIVEIHGANVYRKKIVRACLVELNDSEGLRQLARTHIQDSDFVMGILAETLQKDKYRCEGLDLTEDHRLAARAWKYTNIVAAITVAEHLKGEQDKPLRKELEEILIRQEPYEAMTRFFSERRDNGYGSYSHICTNKEGMIAVGKRFIKLHEPKHAIEAFELANHTGPELIEAGIEILKEEKLREYNNDRVSRSVLKQAAIPYLEQGGNPEIANQYIAKGAGDDINRHLASALEKKCPSRAYERLMSIKERSVADTSLLATLREQLVSESWSGIGIFAQHKDEEGMRLFIERHQEKDPVSAYKTALALGYQNLIDATRNQVLSGKLRNALEVFEEAKDQVGIQRVKERLAPGVAPALVDKLLMQKT